MKFQEQGLIIYPYVTNNQLVYEVDYNGYIRQVLQELPNLVDERWECFGVDVDIDSYTSTVVVDTVNIYE